MTIGLTGTWQPKAGLLVRDTSVSGKPVSQNLKVKQMLALVGNDPTAINTAEMDKQGLHKAIRGFDPENVSTKQMGKLSEMLRSRGLISEITSINLFNAGDKFDRFGVPKDIDAKFNALEYFATQLDNIQSNNIQGNKYANALIPEYKKAIYVLQNLKTYGQGGERLPPTDKGVSAKA
ncbi:hypothetical protein ACOI9X_19745 [Pseudomonas sp. P2757]|uniref:hypothetical protein n=1 Tax=unclassified Pseudomonas TaxID=196821 RepID=UPI003B58D080